MQQPLPSLIDYLIRIPKESTLKAAFRQPGESSGDRESGMIQHLYLLTNMHRPGHGGRRRAAGRGETTTQQDAATAAAHAPKHAQPCPGPGRGRLEGRRSRSAGRHHPCPPAVAPVVRRRWSVLAASSCGSWAIAVRARSWELRCPPLWLRGAAGPPSRLAPWTFSAAPPARDSDCTHTIGYADASILLTGARHAMAAFIGLSPPASAV